MLLFLFVAEPPDGQQLSLDALGLFTFLPVVLVVVILAVLFILADHPLHDLHTSFERSRVSSTFLLHFGFSFFIFRVLFLHLFDIGIPDIPLRDFSSQILDNRRTGGCTSVFDGGVDCLHLSTPVVELVAHGLLYRLNVLARARFFLFCLTLDLLELGLADVLDLLLDLVLIGRGVDVVPLQAEVHDHLIDGLILLVLAL